MMNRLFLIISVISILSVNCIACSREGFEEYLNSYLFKASDQTNDYIE